MSKITYCLLCFYALLLVSCDNEPVEKVKVSLPSEIYFSEGEALFFEGDIHNNSQEDLRITNITTSCSCISLNDSLTIIPKHSSVSLKFKFKKDQQIRSTEAIYFISDEKLNHISHKINFIPEN